MLEEVICIYSLTTMEDTFASSLPLHDGSTPNVGMHSRRLLFTVELESQHNRIESQGRGDEGLVRVTWLGYWT